MRIAMIGQKGIPANYGGIERHVHELSVRLVRMGHDVTVYSRAWYTGKEDHVFEGIHVINTPGIHTKHLDAISHTFTATLRAVWNKFDVIHYHAVGPALLSWIPRIFSPKTKIVTTFHCIDRYHQKWGGLARFALRIGEWAACRFAHETIVVSKTLQQYCANEFHAETHYVPNGVTRPSPVTSHETLDRFGLTKGKYLLVVSRLVPHKGIHLLIEAFQNLQKRNSAMQSLKLAIVGGSSFTDDYVRELHTLASASNTIVFTDFQFGDALGELFDGSIALVHPSMNEGLPIGVLEAMSYQKPVLLSNIPEHLEILNDQRMIFAQNDVRAIEDTLYAFLQLSEEEKASIGKANFETIQKAYDWEKIVPQIEAIYVISRTREKNMPMVKEVGI